MAINARTHRLHATRKLAIASTLVTVLPACSNMLGDRGEERNATQVVEGPRRPPILNPQGAVGKQLGNLPAPIPQGFVPPEYAAENPAPAPLQTLKAQEQLRTTNSAALETPIEQPVIVQESPSMVDDMLGFFGLGEKTSAPAPSSVRMENMALEAQALADGTIERKPLPSHPGYAAPAVRIEPMALEIQALTEADSERKPLQSSPKFAPKLIAAPTFDPAPALDDAAQAKQIQAPLKLPEEVTLARPAPAPAEQLLASVSSSDKIIPSPPSETLEPVAYRKELEPENDEEGGFFAFIDRLLGRGDEAEMDTPQAVPTMAEPTPAPLVNTEAETQLSDGADRLQAVSPVPPDMPDVQREAPVWMREMESEKATNEGLGQTLREEVAEDAPDSLRQMQLSEPPLPLPLPAAPVDVVPTTPLPPHSWEMEPAPATPPAPSRQDDGRPMGAYLLPPSPPENIAEYLLPDFDYPPQFRSQRVQAQASMTEVWYMAVNLVTLDTVLS